MKKLYEKNELAFSILWIVLYVVFFSVADNLSRDLGTMKMITAPLCVGMTVFLAVWIVRNGLRGRYGLGRVSIEYRRYLYFLPLVVIASVNLWNGIHLRFSVLETILYVISMICVGFIEEVIFRGFLFHAISKDSMKQAVLISSLTFGIGHIVNLLNGAEFVSTLLQIGYSVAIGFLFTAIFCKTGSLIACIFTHSVMNSLSAFAREGNLVFKGSISVLLMFFSFAYGCWIWKKGK